MVVTRGTTPTIRFKLPFETDVIQNCEVYLSQPNLLIVKKKNDWTVNTDTAGKVTISGTIRGTTDITLYLAAM